MKVLIVEDNKMLGDNLSMYLKLKEIDNRVFESVEDAKIALGKEKFDIFVLDINLPGMSGLDYCKELREEGNNIPIIILTSKNTHEDIITGLNYGADDYVSKPFNYEEFIARLNSLDRRGKKVMSDTVKLGDIEIDLEYKKVSISGKNIFLSALEYRLLEFLVKNRKKVIDRATLYEEVWGEFDKYMFSRNVDIYVGYLRKKLGKNIIKTKSGEGYFVS